jgi:hypothetical protein
MALLERIDGLLIRSIDIGNELIHTLAIGAPSPPSAATMTLVKLLPFAPIIFINNWRSSIQPNSFGLGTRRPTLGTAEFLGVNSSRCPFRRYGSKSIDHRSLAV